MKINGFTLLRSIKVNRSGFTLVELLVVISIVAILSAVAVVAYSGITAKARDNQRIRDLQAIKQGLELYRSDMHNYPKTVDFPLNSATSLVGIGITYLQVPKDSDSTKNYYYSAMTTSGTACDNISASSACLNFILCAKKEGSDTSYDLLACNTFDCGNIGVRCNIGISSQ